ncbi:hypothetical protein [Streptomyces sp. NPDC000961]|uniref:hypothetical protein n=1 Tax=Streptomyces sp. NPDC000961 TaxID=3364541 RepID=UPI0036C7C8D5
MDEGADRPFQGVAQRAQRLLQARPFLGGGAGQSRVARSMRSMSASVTRSAAASWTAGSEASGAT